MYFVLLFSYVYGIVAAYDNYPNETINGTLNDFAFESPDPSCPPESIPFLVNGQPKECQPGVITTCPAGAMCYYDSVRHGYICCNKLQGYCPVGKPYLDPVTKFPKTCVLNQANACLTPFTCQTIKGNAVNGYCCPDSLNVEPPPIGCPLGSRPMKDENGQELTCIPTATNTCPGNGICYTDTLTGNGRCCGVDPGEGCPSGTKLVKNNGQAVPCLPGEASQACPSVSICQWNYLIDRYQCCVTDNGCPDNLVPFVDSNNKIQKCTQGTPNTCTPNFSCEFNFWISTYQCCGMSLGSCPATQVAYLDLTTSLIRACYSYQSSSCATGYTCIVSSTNQPICCAAPGQPAAGYKFTVDQDGRFKSCLPTITTSCAAPSVCIASVGGPPGLSVCSDKISRCTNGKSAYPSETDPAVCMFTSNCPTGYTCDLSAAGTSSICCGTPAVTTATSATTLMPTIQCPNNFTPQSGVYVPCTASWSNSCLKDASCLQSPNVPGIFLCCMPSSSPLSTRVCTQDRLYFWAQNQNPQTCNPNYIFSGCPTTHSMCLNYPSLNGFYCCKVDLCSNGGEPCWLLGSTIPQYCGGTLNACPTGYTCLPSSFFGSNICCKQKLWYANDAPQGPIGIKMMDDDVQTKNEIEHMANLLKQSSSIFLAVDQPKNEG